MGKTVLYFLHESLKRTARNGLLHLTCHQLHIIWLAQAYAALEQTELLASGNAIICGTRQATSVKCNCA